MNGEVMNERTLFFGIILIWVRWGVLLHHLSWSSFTFLEKHSFSSVKQVNASFPINAIFESYGKSIDLIYVEFLKDPYSILLIIKAWNSFIIKRGMKISQRAWTLPKIPAVFFEKYKIKMRLYCTNLLFFYSFIKDFNKWLEKVHKYFLCEFSFFIMNHVKVHWSSKKTHSIVNHDKIQWSNKRTVIIISLSKYYK